MAAARVTMAVDLVRRAVPLAAAEATECRRFFVVRPQAAEDCAMAADHVTVAGRVTTEDRACRVTAVADVPTEGNRRRRCHRRRHRSTPIDWC